MKGNYFNMRSKTAVITDTDKYLTRTISRKLSKLGYKIISSEKVQDKPEIDLLVSGDCRCEKISDIVTIMERSNCGQIISLDCISEKKDGQRSMFTYNSYGSERLIRERMKNTDVKISFVRHGFGRCFMDDIRDRYRIHTPDKKRISESLADAVAALAETNSNADIYELDAEI